VDPLTLLFSVRPNALAVEKLAMNQQNKREERTKNNKSILGSNVSFRAAAATELFAKIRFVCFHFAEFSLIQKRRKNSSSICISAIHHPHARRARKSAQKNRLEIEISSANICGSEKTEFTFV
jgi:hypothetical protein